MRIAALLGAALAALAVSTASATVRIRADPGGQIGPYLENLAVLRSSGERVVIDSRYALTRLRKLDAQALRD